MAIQVILCIRLTRNLSRNLFRVVPCAGRVCGARYQIAATRRGIDLFSRFIRVESWILHCKNTGSDST